MAAAVQSKRYDHILCKFFLEEKGCWNDVNCEYAHGQHELVSFCKNCRTKGHTMEKCTQPKKGNVCFYCKKAGHLKTTCPDLLAKAKQCYTCHEIGHESKNCTNCVYCHYVEGELYHDTVNCPKKCEKCTMSDHHFTQCPLRPCRGCGEVGHAGKKCPNLVKTLTTKFQRQ